MKKLAVFIISSCVALNLYAQDEGLQDLDIEELAAVDLEKSSLPIKVDSIYAVSGNTINLGLILPVSKLNEFSEELIKGAQMAADEINSSGKILGRELLLITADDAAESQLSVEKGKILIKNYNVVGFIGPTSSSRFIKVVKEVLPKNPVIIISPSATSVEITHLNDNDLAFRTAASDALQGKTAASFCANNLGNKTAAIFYIDDIHGRGVAYEFKDNFERLGGKVIGEGNYSPFVNLQDFDVTARLAQILKSKPEVLYLASPVNDIIEISNQIGNNHVFNDYKPLIIAPDGARSGDIKLANLNVLEGMYCTSFKSIAGSSFEKKYEARYGSKPVSEETADVYDIVYLYALALMEGKSTDAKVLSTHIRSVSSSGAKVTSKNINEIRALLKVEKDIDYDGLNSSIDFDQHGDVIDRGYQMWQIIDGKFVRDNTEIKMK